MSEPAQSSNEFSQESPKENPLIQSLRFFWSMGIGHTIRILRNPIQAIVTPLKASWTVLTSSVTVISILSFIPSLLFFTRIKLNFLFVLSSAVNSMCNTFLFTGIFTVLMYSLTQWYKKNYSLQEVAEICCSIAITVIAIFSLVNSFIFMGIGLLGVGFFIPLFLGAYLLYIALTQRLKFSVKQAGWLVTLVLVLALLGPAQA